VANPFDNTNPLRGAYDPASEIAAGYQQDAANRISQAKVKARKAYDSGLAAKYGVTDVGKAVKGLTDTELYKTAFDLVTKRRNAAAPKGPSAKPATPATPKPPTVTQPKPATAKAPAKAAAKATTTRRRRRTPARTTVATTPAKVVVPTARKLEQLRTI
jgi:hypothetical protein